MDHPSSVLASVVVSYIRSEDTLPKLLEILERQDYPRELYEIILINGDDFTPRMSEPEGQLLGIKKAKGDIVFLTNSDRYPPVDWIRKHMAHYPMADVVFGPVEQHPVFTTEDLNFANFSAKKEVLDRVGIRYLPSQHDVDFAYRLMKENCRVMMDSNIMVREGDPWDNRHWYLAARNHMVIRKRYRRFPPLSEVRQLRSPWSIVGSVVGLFAKDVKDGHESAKSVKP